MSLLASLVPSLAALLLQAAPPATDKAIIDNERVAVWELSDFPGKPGPAALRQYDVVGILIAKKQGTAFYQQKGTGLVNGFGFHPEKEILIGLKDHPVPALPNTSGFPNAFPRPGVKKLIDNNRVIVWEYTWTPGTPTPMHFHDKDVVVVYVDDGALQSTTPDGEKVVNEYSFGQVKYNPRNRTHTELLVKGTQHAIMMELK